MLGLQIFNSPDMDELLWDFTARARDVSLTTNEHGFAVCSFFVPMTLSESFQVYDRPGLPHVVVTGNGVTVWEGRLEDVAIVNGGVQLGAFGYQRALGDLPYTALWSTTDYSEWFVMDSSMVAATNKDQFSFDNNNRLYITPTNGSTQGTVTPAKIGRWGFAKPMRGEGDILAVSFNYEFLTPADWRGIFVSFGSVVYPLGSNVWGASTTEWTINGSGTLQTGGTTLNIAGTARGMNFRLDYNAADATYGFATGSHYLKITDFRAKATTSGSVLASEIAGALVAYVNGTNSDQISTSTVLIESPGMDLTDEIYEDELPSDILNKLVALGDNQTPPRQWEWGVYEDRRLHFRPRGSQARAWYVDASALELERTIEQLVNSAYAEYQDPSGRKARTIVATDSDSVARYGLTRRSIVSANTTSSAQAGVYRDAEIADMKDIIPRSAVVFDRLYDAAGGLWPLWMCRSGDTITIRNLPPSLSTSLDRIRTFRVSETEYDVDEDVLTVTPESPVPSLQTIEAQRSARER